MKALVIADTHGILNSIYEQIKDQIPEFDMVILLGDHSTTDIRCAQLIANRKVVFRIAGNHDMPYSTSTHDFHAILCNVNPSFTGWQGSHKYKESQYYGYTQDQSLNEYRKMPKADILFSHDGPFNNEKDDAHCGLKGITKYIKKIKPKTFIFGHLHKPNTFKLYDTNCFCVYQFSWFEFDKEGNVLNYKQFKTF